MFLVDAVAGLADELPLSLDQLLSTVKNLKKITIQQKCKYVRMKINPQVNINERGAGGGSRSSR